MAIAAVVENGKSSVQAEASLENITGCWAMNKHLSKDVDSMFKMQKVNWLVRKALKSATIYLNFVQHNTVDPETSMPITHLDIVQTTSVNIAPIKEKRILNGQPCKHKDHIFGSLVTQSRSIRGKKDSQGVIRPDVEPSLGIKDDKVGRFLRGEINVDGSSCAGFLVENPKADGYGEGDGLWTHTVEREENSAWASETVWGFEVINGERCLTSRVVTVDNLGNYQLTHCVFQLLRHGK